MAFDCNKSEKIVTLLKVKWMAKMKLLIIILSMIIVFGFKLSK